MFFSLVFQVFFFALFCFFFPFLFLPYGFVARGTSIRIGEGWLRGLDANSGEVSLIFTATDFLDHLRQVSEAKDFQQKIHVSVEL